MSNPQEKRPFDRSQAPGASADAAAAPPPLVPGVAPNVAPPVAPSQPTTPHLAAPQVADQGGASDTAAVLRAALSGVVDKPSLYLVRAAQATTLRQLKAARKQLRDFNTTARVQLEGQMADLEAAAAQLAGARADLDAVGEFLRLRKQQLLALHPDLAETFNAQIDDDDGGGG